ncbi:ABC transporter ATP-binding protein [Gemmatimonas groenlandica]|uniref:ABC transporter ATP-binding protein n=1 Tax=Gemmatimonas groenlandica TaxID=2732249 RepID=A0A6M4IWM8_9BACT|nr:ABC transporter ATP-binding protein [Gemmatimonas groenlandica]QJR37997.1 ABC transporter ATP-binding protein [Gemmatimonas groenlandica]
MTTPNAVAVQGLSHRYGRKQALRDLDLTIPEGATYALLGANGAGKTTLLRLLAGIERVQSGAVSLFGDSVRSMSLAQRQRFSYVAEGQELPTWMRLEQMEAYCAPLYPTWDAQLAAQLRTRFDLDSKQKIGTMSRGQCMKAALLCALASRPRLLLMDEPFTGMDVSVRDELVRGLLDTSGEHGWTVVVSTHDIAEIEMMVDWVGFLRDGRIDVSAPLEKLRETYRRVEFTLAPGATLPVARPASWLRVEQSGQRVSVLGSGVSGAAITQALHVSTSALDEHDVTLRELYLALATPNAARSEAVA